MTQETTSTVGKGELIHVMIIVGMFVASALCWNQAPDRVPMHWNARGEVDGWGGKLEGLFLLPGIAVGIYALLRFIPLLDPGRENYKQFAGAYAGIRWSVTGLMVVIHAAVLAYVLGYRPNMGMVVGGSTGLLLLFIGNLMSKIRPNWFVGIRTPWTLSSKLSWTKTHRVGGWVFIAIGCLIGFTGFAKAEWAVPVTLVTAIGGSLGLVVYSYIVWRTDPDRIPPAGTSPASEPTGPDEPV